MHGIFCTNLTKLNTKKDMIADKKHINNVHGQYIEFGCICISVITNAVDIPSGGQTSLKGMSIEFLAEVSTAICPLVKNFNK